MKTITGETVFEIPASSFVIGPSSSGYTLNFSADGENFTPWADETPADVNEPVVNAPLNLKFKLVGNTDTVVISY